MINLNETKCVACEKKSPRISPEEIDKLLSQLPQWKVKTIDDIQRLTRNYSFKNFKQAMAFTNQVADVTELENHHPQIVCEWGSVTVSWWTHSINGLHQNDFIMAAKTDEIKKRILFHNETIFI